MAGTSNKRTGQGRRSAQAQAVITAGPGVQRPEPPDEFAEPERAYWRKFTSAMPIDWFSPESLPLLARLCVLLVMAEKMEATYRAAGRRFADKQDHVAYCDFIKLIAAISTRLRMTPQSRFYRHKIGARMHNVATYRPWETDDEGPKLRVVD